MLDEERIEYYTRREVDERKRAELAATHDIAKLHIRLAESYSRIIAAYAGLSASGSNPRE